MDSPIGIVDSGVGGLTVARAIIDQLPHESITYFGDTANGPYGPRPQDEVRTLALGLLDTLVDEGVKMLVIACNTASAAMFDEARERYAALGIPVVEVIQPAARAALKATRTGRIGVIGTEGTVASGAYDRAFAALGHEGLVSVAAPKFVEFVEAGVTSGTEVIEAAQVVLDPIMRAGVDTLVLGCTHYPLLAGAIGYVCGPDVRLVSSAEETAADVFRLLTDRGMLRVPGEAPEYRFEATADAQAPFLTLARRFLGPEVTRVEFTHTGVIELSNGGVS